jgi:hypothetical protein
MFDLEEPTVPAAYETIAELDARIRTERAEQLIREQCEAAARCRVDHVAVKNDEAAWATLRFEGLTPTYDEPDQPQTMETRTCFCGTSISRCR